MDKEQGFFVKIAAEKSLYRESVMTEFFHKKCLGADVVGYFSNEKDWLVTQKVSGDDCITQKYLDNPEKLCDKLAEVMHILHQTDIKDCPKVDVMQDLLSIAEKNRVCGALRKDEIPQKRGFATADDAWKCLSEGKELLKSDMLVHGDFCLPNIMLDNWRFSAFIDLDGAGVGDRHIDLFWGAWTLRYNLHTDCYKERFFDAYGRDKIDLLLLELIETAERFG